MSAFRKLSSIYVFSYFPFGFEGRIGDLTVSVPDRCLSFYFEDHIICIKSSPNAPKLFLKRKSNEMRINLFNGKILLAWKANLDIQPVLELYGYAS